MLARYAIQRFAPNHSPTREARELFNTPGPTGPLDASHPPNPDETPIARSESGHEGTGHDVEGQQGTTKALINGVIEKVPTSEKVRERIASINKKLIETSAQLKNTEDLLKNPNTQMEQKEKHLENIKANTGFISDSQETMGAWDRLLHTVDDWGGGKMHPENFCNALSQNLFGKNKQGENVNMRSELTRDMAEKLYETYPEARNWETLNVSQRIEIAEESKNYVLDYMNKYLEKLDAALQKQQDYGKILEQSKKDIEEQEKRSGGGFGLEWYSINHGIAAVKNVIDAFKKAGEEWSQLKIASLSHKLGKMVSGIPIIGDSALQTLEQTLNHKDDEVAKHYQEHLESDLAPFSHMIDGHHGPGLLSRNKNDGNRFRGSLQYMAKHAWLYDIDLQSQSVMGYQLIPGKTVPATWSTEQIREYLRELERQNQAGQEAETKRGFARVDFAGTIDSGIAVLQEEIKDGNYWAVRGISQRLLAKAKDGYTATWIASTIMRALRDDPQARRYFPFELLDRLGNEGLTHLAMTNIYWVIDRRDIRDWQKATWDNPNAANERVEESGNMGKITSQIEKKIRKIEEGNNVPQDKQLQTAEMDKLIAKILASRVINSKDDPEPKFAMFKGITIFHNDFKWYRDGFKKTEGNTIDPSKTDDDFTKEDSEIVLHGSQVVSAILRVASPDNLTYDAKAHGYLSQLIKRDNQLAAAGLTAEQENLREETREVMKSIFANTWTADAVRRFVELQHPVATAEGKKLLEAMVAHELIDMDHLKTVNTRLAETLCGKIKDKDGKYIVHDNKAADGKKKVATAAKENISKQLQNASSLSTKAAKLTQRAKQAVTSTRSAGKTAEKIANSCVLVKPKLQAKQAVIDGIANPGNKNAAQIRKDESVGDCNAVINNKDKPKADAITIAAIAKDVEEKALALDPLEVELKTINEKASEAAEANDTEELKKLQEQAKAKFEQIDAKAKEIQAAHDTALEKEKNLLEMLTNMQNKLDLAQDSLKQIDILAVP